MEATTNSIIRAMAEFLEGGFDVAKLLETTGQTTVEEAIQNGAVSFSEIGRTVARFTIDDAMGMLDSVGSQLGMDFPDTTEVDALFTTASTMPLRDVASKLAESF